ncbi:MAG: hypothetical protein JSW66_06220 [Phycisphaerales bacterium]|nr:MAG: hypothetical protein JSW66_06220 [Phycisphaerales bacterium]
MTEGQGDAAETSPMPLGRNSARGASQQSPILRHGSVSEQPGGSTAKMQVQVDDSTGEITVVDSGDGSK